MNYICSWLCVDQKGEESLFPQTGELSSGQRHQNIYWRCLILFFATSRRFNKLEQHLFFTNTLFFPKLDGKDVKEMLDELYVKVIYTDFKYKTPKGYFGMFQNQFYEFSILEYISLNFDQNEDLFLITDSDCIFLKSARELFTEAERKGFLSFEDDCTEELVIHGLSRKDMRILYQQLLGKEVKEVPGYHLGEFFLASLKNTRTLFSDFLELWPEMQRRHNAGLPKFNEEAQTLSFLYYKNGFKASPKRTFMKRIWTNPVFYRNVDPLDTGLVLWHLPSEKTFGLSKLYKRLIKPGDYGFNYTHKQFTGIVQSILGIPRLTLQHYISYYLLSYYRAIRKRIKRVKLNLPDKRLAVKI